MAIVSLIRPLDQPPGKRRLLADLRSGLRDDRFNRFRLMIAYAKSGPLLRLSSDIEKWRLSGGKTEAIIGIDQHGTSLEALELALALFDEVYVTQERSITFHPKIYLFTGVYGGRAFVGSHNLTVGGTETNFESSLQLDLDGVSDSSTLQEFNDAWSELLPAKCPATRKLNAKRLMKLVANGDVLKERSMRRNSGSDHNGRLASGKPHRARLKLKPPSALPKRSLPPAETPRSRTTNPRQSAIATTPTSIPPTANGLAIQIKPHHNGEIFLSVLAVRQYPSFFRWPFEGATTPKKPGNPSYPQLLPDPVVNIIVYGAAEDPILTLNRYSLNTIYYERKKEVRVTASPLVGVVPDYSVMIIEAR